MSKEIQQFIEHQLAVWHTQAAPTQDREPDAQPHGPCLT